MGRDHDLSQGYKPQGRMARCLYCGGTDYDARCRKGQIHFLCAGCGAPALVRFRE